MNAGTKEGKGERRSCMGKENGLGTCNKEGTRRDKL